MVQRRATRFVVWNYNRTAKVGVILDKPGRKSLKSIVDKLESDTDLSRQDLASVMANRRESDRLIKSVRVCPKWIDKSQVLCFPRTIREWNSLPEDISRQTWTLSKKITRWMIATFVCCN